MQTKRFREEVAQAGARTRESLGHAPSEARGGIGLLGLCIENYGFLTENKSFSQETKESDFIRSSLLCLLYTWPILWVELDFLLGRIL